MNILIVDDNSDDRRLLRYSLAKHGCEQVIEARDGREGLEMAKVHRPDLIISDALMPRMDGFEFLRMVKMDDELKVIPFVFHSAVYTGLKDKELALSLGAEAFIDKPKDPEEFWEELAVILKGLEAGRERPPAAEPLAEEKEYLRKHSGVVAAKLEEKVRELEETLERRKKAEEALKSSEIRYRRLFEAAKDGILILYADTGKIIDVNPFMVDLLGYPPEEYLGRTLCDAGPFRETETCNTVLCDVQFREYLRCDHLSLKTLDGNLVDVEFIRCTYSIDDEMVIQCNIRDITERKRAEQALAERERVFRSLAENITDNIARYDRYGRTLYINPSLEKTIGIKLEDTLGKTPRERKVGDRFDDYIETLEDVVSTGVGNTLELTFPDGNGDFVHHQINFVPELDQDGEMIGILAIGRDITELRQSMRKLIAEQQSRAEMALELSMAEERERHAIAAELHDRIGQDLALAKMRLGMLTRVANGEKVSSLLNGVRESLDNALYNVRTLTRRISPPILESGSLVAALKWLCRQVESDYGLQVLFDEDGNEESVSRDIRGEIYNAVRELLINVIKHAGATSARVVVGSDKGRLLVRVEDDGIGFDPLSVDACSTGEASGFGLSNVRRRINHLGGTLRIESVPGDGCRISIGVAVAAIPPVA